MDSNLINSLIPLVQSIAKGFYNVEHEDLIQAGILGIINAYKHYDSKSSTKFSTFAYPYIYGEMYNLSIKSKSLKYNKDTLNLIKLIDKAKIYLAQSLSREPTVSDIAQYLNIDETTISNAIVAVQNMVSLDSGDYEDSLYNVIKYIQDKDTLIDIKKYLNNLTREERNILLYRYFKDMTQGEVAKKLNISQVSVSRYEQKSLKKLKKIMVYE